jgi:hypothetical protein
MFISKAEKDGFHREIVGLKAKIQSLENSLSYVVAQLACMPPKEKKTKGWTWSEESKTEASSRMKKYWAERKAKEAS